MALQYEGPPLPMRGVLQKEEEILELDVDTFFWDLKLAALDDLDNLGGLVATSSLHVLDLLDDFVALEDLAEDDVATVEPAMRSISQVYRRTGPYTTSEDLRSDDGGDEELRAVGVRTGVGHGQETLLGVLELEVLVLELVAVDYQTTTLAI
jgi:hypothetical protein